MALGLNHKHSILLLLFVVAVAAFVSADGSSPCQSVIGCAALFNKFVPFRCENNYASLNLKWEKIQETVFSLLPRFIVHLNRLYDRLSPPKDSSHRIELLRLRKEALEAKVALEELDKSDYFRQEEQAATTNF